MMDGSWTAGDWVGMTVMMVFWSVALVAVTVWVVRSFRPGIAQRPRVDGATRPGRRGQHGHRV